MSRILKFTLAAGLIAAAGFAISQPMRGDCDGMGPGMMQGGMARMDPAKMQERMKAMMDKHHAQLKAALKITAAQEGAWKAFVDSAPFAQGMMMHQRPDPAEMAKLSVPQRMEKMKELRTQHEAAMNQAMDKHLDATKALYAALTPEQQITFDAQPMGPAGKHPGMRGKGMGQGMGPGMATPAK
jgi:hypothetical protein